VSLTLFMMLNLFSGGIVFTEFNFVTIFVLVFRPDLNFWHWYWFHFLICVLLRFVWELFVKMLVWSTFLKSLHHAPYKIVAILLLNPLTAIFPKMPVPKPILDTTQILFATILFVCFDNYNTCCSQFVTHLHFFIDRNLGSSHPSVPAVPWTG